MFLEIVKDVRTGYMQSYKLVTKEDMIKRHPFCMDLKGWADGGRLNSRFGLSNTQARFIYVKTDKTEDKELETIARSF